MEKIITTRTMHECCICNGIIPAGVAAYSITTLDEMGYHRTVYTHIECWEVEDENATFEP